MTATPNDADALHALGLVFVPEFLSEREEHDLLSNLMVQTKVTAYAHPGRSRVQRYGSRKPYNNYMVSDFIPLHFEILGDRLVARELLTKKPDSITVNEYLAGDIIAAHVDAIGGGPVITVLSLGTTATMVLKRGELSYTVELPPRSVIQLRDEMRYKWTHEILPVKATRYSVVFRNSTECEPEA